MNTQFLQSENFTEQNLALLEENTQELVSVVIPTRNRPQIVIRAVKSALAQTLPTVEVIVVVDGPDEATVQALSQITDPRLRVIELATNVGPSGARNTGVREAKGNWIAFLDDDDEWMPQKLQLQIDVAKNSQFKFPVVSSRFVAFTPKGEFIWPRRLLEPTEHLSEYLFVRKSLFLGEGFMHTSTLFTKKELLIKIPFNINKSKHEDWEWLFEVNNQEDVGIEFVPEPTAYWHSDIGQQRLSNKGNWQYCLEWIKSVQHLITPQAYSSYLMTVACYEASSRNDRSAFWILLRESIKFGKPRLRDYFLYLVMWLFPQDVRKQVNALVQSFKKMITK
ncbi:glycosyltransferase family 2 protein [Nostoc sp. FACHB-152]|uniref:glycosyltransferase family 2 protein n=1 Tax=unclassified Nostoc TaxID=2593658 RepID=UPI00168251B2|nr:MULTISPECIES: glycosyltransferase family 2 protein [unclassified Nostoc]MBD2447501.1 glycosyltransferase family 2 protein [Nostoc sp. FACHB-152]MBD2468311.1 glycosyltransferase family 2 protein [Nostoc sp. FACHB-145]